MSMAGEHLPVEPAAATVAALLAADTGQRDPYADARAAAVRVLGERAAAAIVWGQDPDTREALGEMVAADWRGRLLHEHPEPGSELLLVELPAHRCAEDPDHGSLWAPVEDGADLLAAVAGERSDDAECRACRW